ncbi:MAG: type II toxin-antitoxin system VapC family toxin [Betaproteobacteria bacterium]|jgi:PIN domain nuclease of toxin-antitoxin system|nr:type II toxin-antitoxin system VapC family toxin [Betaproteobacteria bacterium]
MILLLDTHVLLWTLMAPQRLSPALRAALTRTDTRVQFSAASVWEIAIKRALGRPDFAFEPDTVAQAALDTDFEPLPVRHDHAARVRHLPPLHADPFDRLLLAQAQCEGTQLVTADRALMAYPAPLRWVDDF